MIAKTIHISSWYGTQIEFYKFLFYFMVGTMISKTKLSTIISLGNKTEYDDDDDNINKCWNKVKIEYLKWLFFLIFFQFPVRSLWYTNSIFSLTQWNSENRIFHTFNRKSCPDPIRRWNFIHVLFEDYDFNISADDIRTTKSSVLLIAVTNIKPQDWYHHFIFRIEFLNEKIGLKGVGCEWIKYIQIFKRLMMNDKARNWSSIFFG